MNSMNITCRHAVFSDELRNCRTKEITRSPRRIRDTWWRKGWGAGSGFYMFLWLQISDWHSRILYIMTSFISFTLFSFKQYVSNSFMLHFFRRVIPKDGAIYLLSFFVKICKNYVCNGVFNQAGIPWYSTLLQSWLTVSYRHVTTIFPFPDIHEYLPLCTPPKKKRLPWSPMQLNVCNCNLSPVLQDSWHMLAQVLLDLFSDLDEAKGPKEAHVRATHGLQKGVDCTQSW